MHLGCFAQCEVESELPQGFYLLTPDGERVLLPGSKAPAGLRLGQEVRVFLYLDSEDRPIATTQVPLAQTGEFAVLEVKEVNDYGAFLDWGIDKDLLLPYRHQLGELRPGDLCVVYVMEDGASGRIVATEKLRPFFDRETSVLRPGEKVELIAYDFQDDYIDCVIDKRYTGRLYGDPERTGLHIGDRREGYIQNVREDEKVDVSLSPVGYRATMSEADRVLRYLEEKGGFSPLGDHSDPAAIQEAFGMSKKAFKKILGGLYREGKVELQPDGTRLKKRS